LTKNLGDSELHAPRAPHLVVCLRHDGKIAGTLWCNPRLENALPVRRRDLELAGAGRGIHSPDVDEDLSLKGMLRRERLQARKGEVPVIAELSERG
jgi:Protein of unknown function (DUF2442)